MRYHRPPGRLDPISILGLVMLTVGVDIGGTKVFAALVDADGSVIARASRPTDPEAGTASIVQALEDLLEATPPGEPPAAIGVAAAAYVEFPSGRISFAPNLSFGQSDIA